MTQEIMNETKAILKSKTDCMVESYGEVLTKTEQMFEASLAGHGIDGSEITKRADMFWNIALQKIEKEQQEVKVKLEQEEHMKMQQMQMQRMPPQGMPPMGSDGKPIESPCAKKARESAEKVVELEAKLVEDKEK